MDAKRLSRTRLIVFLKGLRSPSIYSSFLEISNLILTIRKGLVNESDGGLYSLICLKILFLALKIVFYPKINKAIYLRVVQL